MYTTIADFIAEWKTEASSTVKTLAVLSDESLAQRVVDGHRTLGRIAWHIVTTIPEMTSYTGLKLEELLKPDSPVPPSATAICDAYKAVSLALFEKIEKEWTDETLLIEDEMYGETWPRRVTLNALVQHQIHHRGQITILMRQAGIKVPSIYGPAKEDWHEFGMDAPEI